MATGNKKGKTLSIHIFKDLNFPEYDENILDKIDFAKDVIDNRKIQLERIKNNNDRPMRRVYDGSKPFQKCKFPTGSVRKLTSMISKSKNPINKAKKNENNLKAQTVKNQTCTSIGKNVVFSEDFCMTGSLENHHMSKEMNSSISNDHIPNTSNINSVGSPRPQDEYLLLMRQPSTRNELPNLRLNSSLSNKKEKIVIKNFLGRTAKKNKAIHFSSTKQLETEPRQTSLKYHPIHKTLYNIKKASVIPVNKRILNACNLLSFVNINLNNELHNGIKRLIIPHIPKNAKDERRLEESDLYKSIPLTLNNKNSETYLTYRHISTSNKAERDQMRMTYANDDTAKLIRIGDMANKLSTLNPSSIKPLELMYNTENKKLQDIEKVAVNRDLLKLNTYNVFRNNFEISRKKHLMDVKRLRLFTKTH